MHILPFTRPLRSSLLVVGFVAGCTSSAPVSSPPDDAGSPAPDASSSPNPDPADAARVPATPPASCFEGVAACDPVTNAGCLEGEVCDLLESSAELVLGCEVVPGDRGPVPAGEACSPAAGDRCAPGYRCQDRRCQRSCCTDADCTATGERCVTIEPNIGTFGTCGVPPECAGPGGACTFDRDCCSNDCHSGHCH